jgi:hypothetical protein
LKLVKPRSISRAILAEIEQRRSLQKADQQSKHTPALSTRALS